MPPRALLLIAAALALPAWAAAETPDPLVQRTVVEDDQVRIETLRVRGETQRIVVKSKMPGVREYEIVPATGAADPSQAQRRPPGDRVWRLFSF